MPGIEAQLYSISRLDSLSRMNSPIHRMHPLVKIILTFTFIVVVTSYSRYAVAELLPFFAFPLLLIAAADLPTTFLLKRIIVVSPFAIAVGVFNPVFDREILLTISGLAVTGGWVSFVSILLRFGLCMSAALVLVATTGFYNICTELQTMKVPSVLTVQFLLLYRYLFLLADEALRLILARKLRSFGRRAEGMRSTGALIASLLGRTLQRGRRIHEAMSARGLTFSLPSLRHSQFRWTDALVLLAGVFLLVLMRMFDLSAIIGTILTGGSS